MITGTQDHLKLLVEPSSDAKKIQELDQSRSLSLVKAEHAEHERRVAAAAGPHRDRDAQPCSCISAALSAGLASTHSSPSDAVEDEGHA